MADGRVAGDPYAMALQPDGQAVVVGDSIDPASQTAATAIARYNSGLAVQVNNVEPSIPTVQLSATGDSYSTGQTVTLYGSFTDPVPQASRTVTIDWGDGTSGNPDTTTLPLAAGVTTFSTSARQYAASGQYIITVSVGDAVGSGPAATLPVTYNDLAPANVALSMPSTPILLNQAFDLSGTFTDPESSQSQTVIIDWGDALDGYPPDTTTVNPSPGATSFSNQPHTYSGDGSYIISVTVANSLGTSAPQTATVDVLDTAPTTNLVVGSFTVDAGGNLSVGYTVDEGPATPFTIGVYSSVDGVQLGNMVQSVDVSDPGLLAVGSHTVTFAVQSGALSGGGYYVADLDVYDEIAETSKADNESAPLAGVFQASDGSVYVFASSTGASRTVSVANGTTSGSVVVTIDSVSQAFQDVSYLYATTYRTRDTVSVDSAVQVPFTEFDPAAGVVDVGFYLSPTQPARTELDLQAAIDAVHGGTGGASVQLSAIEGGDLMEVWDAPEGGNQLSPVDGVFATWGFSSTGQVNQSVWISEVPGGSDPQVALQLQGAFDEFGQAIPGTPSQLSTQPTAGGFRIEPCQDKPGVSDRTTVLHWNGNNGRQIECRSPVINPTQLHPLGEWYKITFPAAGPCQAAQRVVDSGKLVLHLGAVSGGGDGGTGTFTVTWTESYTELFNGQHTPTVVHDVQDQHTSGPQKAANYLEELPGAQGYQISADPATHGLKAKNKKTGKEYRITAWEWQMSTEYEITNEQASFKVPWSQSGFYDRTTVFAEICVNKKRHQISRTPENRKTLVMDWYINPAGGKAPNTSVNLDNPKNYTRAGATLKCGEARMGWWEWDPDSPTSSTLEYITAGYM